MGQSNTETAKRNTASKPHTTDIASKKSEENCNLKHFLMPALVQTHGWNSLQKLLSSGLPCAAGPCLPTLTQATAF